MSEDNAKTVELLGEIVKLLRKYGKQAFSDLAWELRNGNLPNRLADFLENSAKLGVPSKQTKKRLSLKEEQAQFRKSLVILGETEPEKAGILTSVLNALQAKAILPTLKILTAFIADQGLEIPKAKSREKVALSFLRQCSRLPLGDLQALADKVSPRLLHKDADRSLAGWGRIILDRKKERD